jgi:aminoglycoside phosphotransferase (APT) family kinase protein
MISMDVSDRLLDELRAATQCSDLAYARPPEPLTGGFWAELLQFSVSGGPADWPTELVARLMPDPALARKETIVQAEVACAGYPTPAVRVSGDASSALGRAYMVMDRAPGAPLLNGLNGVAALLHAPRLARRIPEVLAQAMAALHALDPIPVREKLAGVGAVTTDMAGMLDGLVCGASECGREDLESAARALKLQARAHERARICHGDLHPFNLLMDEDGTVTVLDWSAALIAPGSYDVAFTSLLLAEPPLALPNTLRPFVRAIGRRLAARFVNTYEHRANGVVDVGELSFFQAVVCLRALVEVSFWVATDVIETRAGHPWLTNGAPFAERLSTATGVDVRPR